MLLFVEDLQGFGPGGVLTEPLPEESIHEKAMPGSPP
jgi:hypothetical protein